MIFELAAVGTGLDCCIVAGDVWGGEVPGWGGRCLKLNKNGAILSGCFNPFQILFREDKSVLKILEVVTFNLLNVAAADAFLILSFRGFRFPSPGPHTGVSLPASP